MLTKDEAQKLEGQWFEEMLKAGFKGPAFIPWLYKKGYIVSDRTIPENKIREIQNKEESKEDEPI